MKHHILVITIVIFILQINELRATPRISNRLSYFSFPRTVKLDPYSKKPKILSLCTLTGRGGIEVSTLALHKQLINHGYDPVILVGINTFAQEILYNQKISHYTSKAHTALHYDDHRLYRTIFIKQIRELCKNLKIDIVQCNLPEDTLLARQATKGLPTKVILMFHAPRVYALECFKNLDAVLPVNTDIMNLLNQENEKLHLGIGQIMHLFPFFNEDKCLNFKPLKGSKKNFFKEQCELDIDTNTPIICMVGNFYGPPEKLNPEFIFQKNQELLIRALHKLIYERNKKAYVIFVGDGPNRIWHQKLAQELGLTPYAHFLGFRQDTCDILHHINIHVLASREESFGIAHIEAALHKKPSLGATSTGVEYIIINGITGLIFENNNVLDLTNKLEFLMDNPEQAHLMGNNAYNFVTESKDFKKTNIHFLTHPKFKRVAALYEKIIK